MNRYDELVSEIKQNSSPEEFKVVFAQDCCEYALGKNDTFLGFLLEYDYVRNYIPKDVTTILDLGCYLAAQSYLFVKYEKYIGIDINDGPNDIRFTPPNAVHEDMSIQEYISQNEFQSNEVFAICSYVPDKEAMRMVEDTFANCYICYPERGNVLKVNGKYIINNSKTISEEGLECT